MKLERSWLLEVHLLQLSLSGRLKERTGDPPSVGRVGIRASLLEGQKDLCEAMVPGDCSMRPNRCQPDAPSIQDASIVSVVNGKRGGGTPSKGAGFYVLDLGRIFFKTKASFTHLQVPPCLLFGGARQNQPLERVFAHGHWGLAFSSRIVRIPLWNPRQETHFAQPCLVNSHKQLLVLPLCGCL